MPQSCDVIVVGCGGVGSATIEQLARRNLRVIGLEQFELGHARGSSHGRTRIIRQAYFEHPNYVPLLLDAYQAWAELEQDTGLKLYHRTGLLEVGHPQGELIRGIQKSVAEHHVRVDELTRAEALREFGQFHIDEHCVAVFEHDAGYLNVDECVQSQLQLAREQSAVLVENSPIRRWRRNGGSIEVETENETYIADHLIVTTGAWSTNVFAMPSADHAKLPIEVLKKHVHWFQPSSSRLDLKTGSPIFYFETDIGHFYGFPRLDEHGVKIAEHSGGEVVSDPTNVDRAIDEGDLVRIRKFLDRYLPHEKFEHHDHSVCFYSMTPDGHFLFDHHPGDERVLIAAGLSGHGFKFTRLLGRLLADAVTNGAWDSRVNFLGLKRFSEFASQ